VNTKANLKISVYDFDFIICGFANERVICNKFNNWKKDNETQNYIIQGEKLCIKEYYFVSYLFYS
jgi:hypothetical protein